MPSDSELLHAWRGGDRAAADELLNRHLPDLVRFFRSKLRDDAEDCVHETLVRVLNRGPSLREGSSFRAYMFAVGRNLLFERFRKQSRFEGPLSTSLHDLGASPSNLVAEHQEQQLLLQGLRRVPLDTQILLELFYWENLSVAELAEVFEVPPGTVKSRLHRSRGQLREALAALESEGQSLGTTLTSLDDWARSIRRLSWT